MRMPDKKTLRRIALAALVAAAIVALVLLTPLLLPHRVVSRTVYTSSDGTYRSVVTRYADGTKTEQREEIPHDQAK